MTINKPDIENILLNIQQHEGENFSCNGEVVYKEVQEHANIYSSIAIKMLSIFGGAFASATFIAFLFLAHIIDFNNDISSLITGFICIAAALAGTSFSKNIFLDTIFICIYSLGLCLICIGFESNISLAFACGILIAILTFRISKSFILSFASVILMNGCIIALFVENGLSEYLILPCSIICAVLVAINYCEARMVSIQWINKKYAPLQLGLFISYAVVLALKLYSFFYIHNSYLINYSFGALLLSAFHMIGVLLLAHRILLIYRLAQFKQQWPVYLLIILLLLPTLYAPFISGALLLLLMAFYFNYKFEFALSIALLIYAITRYYYDLSFTLLEKSGILFFSGLIFMALGWYLMKKTKQNESL